MREMKLGPAIVTIFLSLMLTVSVEGQTSGQGSSNSAASLINGEVVPWRKAAGGNDHYYQAIQSPKGSNWDYAQAYARSRGGYLATISSVQENDFVFRLIADRKYWVDNSYRNSCGPWLGAFKVSKPAQFASSWGSATGPEESWEWVNHEGPVTYFNWGHGQPDNSGGNETRIHYYDASPGQSVSYWNDCPASFGARGFVVEYDTDPSAPVTTFGLGDIGMGAIIVTISLLIIAAGVIILPLRNKDKGDGRLEGPES